MTEDYTIPSSGGAWLALDTSTSSMTVAVIEGNRLLGERNTKAERNHSMYLLPTIHELLGELKLRPADLSGFAVGRGPGSYTGVRIGITVAKTMAWALDQPVIGVSSLEAMALGAADSLAQAHGKHTHRWIVPLMDARRGQVYTALFASAADGWTRIREDGIRLMDVWVEELAKAAGPEARAAEAETGAAPNADATANAEAVAEAEAEAAPNAEPALSPTAAANAGSAGAPMKPEADRPHEIWFVGEVAAFAEAIDRMAELWDGTSGAYPHDIHACDVGRLALRLSAEGVKEDVHRLVPNYTQLAEAEAKLLAKNSVKPPAGAAGKRGGENRP
ncbi:tRNA (adenosine(37)-N6)-threonylcarbamoyltransferase complex dimerization subunit type 1 TsaB [Paenibacillus sp. J2TS4]|uniref:tRNA (adenosine(37)-N6)-threonylcarbamoyltransferase complex dimerization subunit type 1 TsaB n=1 Tax=Paenibacillus sp. J2TS4 TaxID=2807194 RepID=UPI001AFCDE05|nr:tRNA (adenosine(37)-N6)-threonylcarbamoyltransferase complex dimerization subunit type 1 TsaB [Paenibacillus sp. J2TS4]GIP35151.1 hypothetical protein J2TS4_43610 [Paenibacillus sp. J2TS4]